MLIALLQRIAEAYLAPRRSARRLLAAEPKLQDGLIMALAGAVLSLVLVLLLERVFGRTVNQALAEIFQAPQAQGARPQGALGPLVIMRLALSIAVFSMISSLVGAIGRRVGGVGSSHQIAAVVGWWFLVAASAEAAQALLALSAGPEQRAIVALAILTLNLYLFYQLAAFLAEAHGFRSVFPVLASMLAATFGLGVVLLALFSMLGMKLPAG